MKHYYGIPYQGSKEKILHLIDYIFNRENNKKYFIDPFCGGFCVSAYALERTKFKVLANDLNHYVIAIYKEILFNNSREISRVWFDWVSREKFIGVRENPSKYPSWYVGYVLTIWSFGNSQSQYLFGKDIEEIKREAHKYLLENGYKENQKLRIDLIKKFKEKEKKTDRFELQQLEQLERLQQLERLEQLQRLERLQQLQRLERLESMDWYDFIQSIPKNILEQSFIYCDPPYENTRKYQVGSMDYKFFWKWFRECPYPVYVSSYEAPEDIKPINFTKKIVLTSAQKTRKRKLENIYFNRKGEQCATLYDLLFNQSPTK